MSPNILTLLITGANGKTCRLKCPDCYLTPRGSRDGVPEHAFGDEQVERLVRTALRERAFGALYLQGHEPAFNIPLTLRLAQMCHEYQVRFGMITSGVLFHHYCEKLLPLDVSPCVSMHGATPETNDNVYGVNVFDDAVCGMQTFIECGGQEKLFVSLTLDLDRREQQLALPEFLASLGVKYLSLNLKLTYENGREQLIFTPDELRPFVYEIIDRCERQNVICTVSNEVDQSKGLVESQYLGARIEPIDRIKRFDQAMGTWAVGNELHVTEDQLTVLPQTIGRFPF